jgi:isopentenyldiphosphate isomerase
VLDDYGNWTGETKSRDEIHAQGLLHRIALACVIDSENRILLQHRSPTKKLWPNKWDLSIAAHVLAGEESVSTVVREMNEEIGFSLERKIIAKDFRFCSSFRQDTDNNGNTEKHWYDLFIILKDIETTNLRFNDNEVDGVMWATYTEIQKIIDRGEMVPRNAWIQPILRFINRF